MKSMEARFAEMTDKQIVASYMTIVGMIWAYNETNYFIGRDTALNRLRREARALRYGDQRRAKLIHDAIEATIVAYRGKPIIDDGEEVDADPPLLTPTGGGHGKRSNYRRHERDNYPTPLSAIAPLLPHLNPRAKFFDPAAGEGLLVEHLVNAGLTCVGKFDLPERDATCARYDDVDPDAIAITNLPWLRTVFHPALRNLSNQRALWTLCDSGWPLTRQAIPYLDRLRKIVAVKRLKWIAGTKHSAMDDAVWLLFDRPRLGANAATEFYGRIDSARCVTARRALQNRHRQDVYHSMDIEHGV
jgi:hypothetical protein